MNSYPFQALRLQRVLHSLEVQYFGNKSTSYLYFQQKFARIFQMGVVSHMNLLNESQKVLKIATVLQSTVNIGNVDNLTENPKTDY